MGFQVQRTCAEQQKRNEQRHNHGDVPPSPQLPIAAVQRRNQLQQLVAEAAKNDWVTFHAAFPHSVVTHSTAPAADDASSYSPVSNSSPDSSCAPSSSSSATSSRGGSPINFANHHSPRQPPPTPIVVVTPEKQGKILVSLERFHRTFWEHVMKDAIDTFDNYLRSHPVHIASLDYDGQISALEEAAYQQAMMRLSRRRMWRSPVTTCLERRNFADFIKENETALENPMKLVWQQQNAQRKLLSTIPDGMFFATDSASASLRIAC
ncbi:Hypothetical protein, putative [Bodo saltans]|uniref:Uncharacterized protein n=1 Tax=Bodo saltans TaxID=75058 RepID=A0A0S4JCU7_BODSA|nr:Hypothetical protein, putative [Bodo saltans]|eukprot:CUG87015.1 Hypothetical protein, putative [Bodo saltans]